MIWLDARQNVHRFTIITPTQEVSQRLTEMLQAFLPLEVVPLDKEVEIKGEYKEIVAALEQNKEKLHDALVSSFGNKMENFLAERSRRELMQREAIERLGSSR